MTKRFLFAVPVLIVAIAAAEGRPSAKPETAPPIPPEVETEEPSVTKEESEDLSDQRENEFQAYALFLMNKLTPAKAFPAADYELIAASIAKAAKSSRDVALLVSLGYHEGARWAKYVDDQLCNDWQWRLSKEGKATMRVGGDCDLGRAYSVYQIHIDGVTFEDGLVTREKIRDRDYATRLALRLATGNLSGYTGEGEDEHPKADKRSRFAEELLRKWPYTPRP